MLTYRQYGEISVMLTYRQYGEKEVNTMKEITLKVGKYTGTAQISWVEEGKWGVAHYAALISVPFQSGRWQNLFVFDKANLAEAMEKAAQYLEMDLSRCMVCG